MCDMSNNLVNWLNNYLSWLCCAVTIIIIIVIIKAFPHKNGIGYEAPVS